MNGYLLDTNALSEGVKKRPDKGFMAWLTAVTQDQLFTSCLVVGELYKGIELAQAPARRQKLEAFVQAATDSLAPHTLPIDTATSKLWARLLAKAQKAGQTPQIIDSLIAAQALWGDLTLVTRNTKDFQQFPGLRLLCPWSD